MSIFMFLVNSVGLGIGLAMDAFSVSAVNGLTEPDMDRGRACRIAGTFGIFQMVMPLLGWVCVNFIANQFQAVQRFIPGIAMLLLFEIGIKMIREGTKPADEEEEEEEKEAPASRPKAMSTGGLLTQGVATSIDALSVGFAIASLRFPAAFAESLIIGLTTFVICLGGIRVGTLFGTKLSGKASVLGGVILILIGIEILITSVI